MLIDAMVVREPGAPFVKEQVELDAPRAYEVLVRIVATGMCRTDLSVMESSFPYPMPFVLGHEAAGIVDAIGEEVTSVAVGDHVVLTFNSCGECTSCREHHEARCSAFPQLNLAGRRPDGSTTLQRGSEPVFGSFFSQSSFATYALADERNTVPVDRDLPLELLGPLGCGIQTGAGTILNILQPPKGSAIAIFGAGAVGLAAVMAAKIAGCGRIHVIDPVPARLALAEELGATHSTLLDDSDILASVLMEGAFDFSFDTSGQASAITIAIRCLGPHGTCVLATQGKSGAEVTLPLTDLFRGRHVHGIMVGDSSPKTFIPRLIELHRSGQLPFERLLRFYDFDDINQAAADSRNGTAIKPVIRMPSSER